MKFLVTGAFGNLGQMVVRELQRQAIDVRCLDLPNARNQRAARAHQGRVELAWGDIRDTAWLARQVEGVDAVIHLAALLWPATENQPELAEAVNYQRRGFDRYRDEMAHRLRWPRRMLWPLRPLLDPLLAAFTQRIKRPAI